MLEVKVPKEISEYREKIAFGLSIRQLVCFIIAFIVGIGTHTLTTRLMSFSNEVASYIVIFLTIPVMAAGFIKKNGLVFEKYVFLYIRHLFGRKKRPYKTCSQSDDETVKRGIKNVKFYKDESDKEGEHARETVKVKDRKIREFETVKTRKKDVKRKRKAALREIKAARKELKKIKQVYKKQKQESISA